MEISPATQNRILTGLIEFQLSSHSMSVEKGMWPDDKTKPIGDSLMGVIAQLSKAYEKVRDEKLMSSTIKDAQGYFFKALEEELADAIILIFDLAGGKKLDLPSAVVAKLLHNQNKEFKKPAIV